MASLAPATSWSKSRSVSGFSSVDQAGEGRLYIEQTGSETLLVRADDNLLQHIQTNVVGDELEIRTAPGVEINPSQAIEYFLTVDDLMAAELTGVGRLECTDLSTKQAGGRLQRGRERLVLWPGR